jgi:TonB family protein
MSSAVTHLTHGTFDIRFRPPAPPARDPDAWQKMIGEKQVGARLDTLPENRISWRALATSTATQVGIVVVLILLEIILPPNLITKVEYSVMPLAGPMIEVPQPKAHPLRPKVEPQPQPVQPPQPQHIAKLLAPRPLPAPKPKPVEVRNAELPKLEQPMIAAKFDAPDLQPVKPREVKTGLLGDSPAGGNFGDPHGLAGETDPTKRINVARVGSFDSSEGPGNGSGTGNGTGVGGAGGKGNGNGVASAGFGSTVLASSRGTGGPKAVQSSGFANAEAATQVPAKSAPKAADEPPPVQSVAILSKPNPVYTDEARKLGIEGEVLVDVVFLASGQIKVEGVEKGLGHGLDESAVRAAQQIHFKPALQEGRAVDFPAVVHIVFQLAY